MKNRKPKHRSPYSLRPQIHGRNPRAILELAMPHSNLKRGSHMFENILRWEEDGGKIVEVNSSTLDQILVQPIRPANHDQSVFRHTPGKAETQ